jgi:ribosomal protein L40E
MTLQLSKPKIELDDEAQLSYYVKHKSRKHSRVGHAKLIDLSEAGLCMEISPSDSDLFLESQGKLFIMSTDIELQIFCRSHPMNVWVSGSIRWFKRKSELGEFEESENIYIGVMFPFANAQQRAEIVDLVRHLKNDNDMSKCRECGAVVSSDAFICYKCGERVTRKRNVLRKMIFGFLGGGAEPDEEKREGCERG